MIEFVSAFCLDGKVDRRRVYRRWLDSDSRGLVVGGLSVVLASRFGFPFEDLVLTVFVMVCFSPSFCQVLLWTAVRSIAEGWVIFMRLSLLSVFGWFTPLVVFRFVGLGLSSLLFRPGGRAEACREVRLGRVGSSLAERSFMVARYTP